MGKSALWSTMAMGNVYFWHEVSTDYFAPQSAQLPFLHLWSLGVEEQFYVLWPAVLVVVWRFGRQRTQALALALAIVLTATLMAEQLLAAEVSEETRFTYHMLPPRAGELALGAAFALARLPRASQRLRNGCLACDFCLFTNRFAPGHAALSLTRRDTTCTPTRAS